MNSRCSAFHPRSHRIARSLPTWIGALCLLAAAGPAHAGGSARSGGPFGTLLREGQEEGRLDRITAALYTLYAVRAPERLPAELRVAREQSTGICATPALVVLDQAMPTLPAALQQEIRGLRERPVSLGYLQSAILPLRVHWLDAAHAALAAPYLARLEESWLAEVNTMGFAAPPADFGIGGSDDFDVYLDGTMGPGDGYCDADVEVPSTWWYDKTSFIDISANTDEPSLSALVAHEFNHACQWAMDAAEDDAFYENTSSYVEDAVYDDVDDNYWYLSLFQTYPYKSLDYFGELYQYGAFPWEAFLCEQYGDGTTALVRDLWNLSRQVGPANEPDYLDALDTAMLPPHGLDLRRFYTRFAQYRWFTGDNDDGRHFAKHYPVAVTADRTILPNQLPTGPLGPLSAPSEFGANYYVFTVGSPGDLRVTLNAPAAKAWSLELVGIPADGSAAEVVPVPVTDGYGRGSIAHWERFARVVMIVCNLGDGDHDPDLDDWGATGYGFSAEKLAAGADVPSAETGPAGLRLAGPNPFGSAGTAVRVSLRAGVTASLGVHDAAGRLVLPLWTGTGPWAGTVAWSGTDREGRAVPSGVYNLVLRQPRGESETVRTIRVR